MSNRLWIIVAAHHCAPGMGSEHAVGFNYVRELAIKHRLILITEDNEFRPAVSAEVEKWNTAGGDVELHFVHHGAKSDGRENNFRIVYYLRYIAYQWRVYQLARRLCANRPVAAIHQLTIVGFREPGFCWLLNKPFIWGPVGGLVYPPVRLMSVLSPRMMVFQALRAVATALQFWLSPRVALAYRAAQRKGGSFIAATEDIGRRFRSRFGGNYVRIPETGALFQPVGEASDAGGPGPLRLLWVGGLIEIKPLGLLLEAMAEAKRRGARLMLDVIGEGGSGPRFRSQAKALGIDVHFHGWVPHREALKMFKERDLFVLLSLKDLTTNVVFESLSNGLPVVCLDHHGYSEVVDDSCGYKIPVGSKGAVIGRLADILVSVALDKTELRTKRRAAIQRAHNYTWERNAAGVSQVYFDAERLFAGANRSVSTAES